MKGLGTIEAAPGLRAFASTRLSLVNFEVSAVKYLGGQNHGVMVNLGLSAPLPLGKTLLLMPHVRATWADGNTMQTYFGVTPAQSAASIFSPFNAGSGFKDVQGGVNLIYSFNRHWFAGADVGVTRLMGDCRRQPDQHLGHQCDGHGHDGLSLLTLMCVQETFRSHFPPIVVRCRGTRDLNNKTKLGEPHGGSTDPVWRAGCVAGTFRASDELDDIARLGDALGPGKG